MIRVNLLPQLKAAGQKKKGGSKSDVDSAAQSGGLGDVIANQVGAAASGKVKGGRKRPVSRYCN